MKQEKMRLMSLLRQELSSSMSTKKLKATGQKHSLMVI